MSIFVCLRRNDRLLYVTLRKSKNAVVFLLPLPFTDMETPWVLGAFILKLYRSTLAKSPNIFTLDFNTILALRGPCTGQGYCSGHRVHVEV